MHPDDEPKTSRRDFLGFLGAALGGMTLAAGDAGAQESGGAGAGRPEAAALAAGPLPNGYRFFSIFTPDGQTHGLNQVRHVTGGVMINDHSEIVFHAPNNSGRHG